MFKIKEIKLVQNNNDVSEITLNDGFNVIYGPSNTGKSVILDCVDFVFGSDKAVNPHFNAKEIKLKVECEQGYAILSRSVGKKTLVVEETNIPNLETREYKKREDAGVSASDVLLRLLGLNERVEILKNATWEKQNLTFRTLSHTFLIKEEKVSTEDSILKPDQNTADTAFKTALLYLLSKDNHIDPEGNPIEKAARKRALEKYLKEQVEKLTTKFNSYSDFKIGEPEMFEKEIADLIIQMEEANQKLDEKVGQSKELLQQIFSINDELAELKNFSDKYDTLLSQYESDLRRLQLIVDGKAHEGEIEAPMRCPFCNGELHKEEQETCEEAAEAELKKLVPQIKDLNEAKENIVKETEALNTKKEKLIIDKKGIDDEINKELKPLIKKLSDKIKKFQTAVVSEAEYNNVQNNLNNAIEELKKVEKIKVEITKFSAREYVESLIVPGLLQRVEENLTACGIGGALDFVYGDFDIKVNDVEKKYQGEGYKGFYNTVMALALQRLLVAKAYYKPGILFVDSPILSLREKPSEEIPDHLKKALFTYLKQCSSEMQIVVIENDIPDIDYQGAHKIEFTKDRNNGRYGFVKNYYED